METAELIEKILEAKKIEDVLDPTNLKKAYFKLIQQIHPDVCHHPKANEAAAKLNELKEHYTVGIPYTDESGPFKSNGYVSVYGGSFDMLQKSLQNYQMLKTLKDKGSLNFHKYLPSEMKWENGELKVSYSMRSVPLIGLTLSQVHVNWVLSRMLEFSAWLSQVGFVHGGINPESVFIVPENHGIQISSFYLLSPLNEPIKGISGKYKNWYPPNLFDTKKATPDIDLELCMKTAIYLLGDQSGMGIKLRKDSNVNQELLDFMIAQHNKPTETWKRYREILSKNFEKKFYVLDI